MSSSPPIGPSQEWVQAGIDVNTGAVYLSGFPAGATFWAWEGSPAVQPAIASSIFTVSGASKNALLEALYAAGVPVPILTTDTGTVLTDDQGNVLLQDGVNDISGTLFTANTAQQIAGPNPSRNFLLVYFPGPVGSLTVVSSAVPASTTFAPSVGDLVLDAFARIQVRPTSLTADHMVQARLSANLLQSEWSNVGMPLLWKQQLLQIPLLPGVQGASYALPSTIIAPLDAFVRAYQAGNAVNFTPSFYTTAAQTTVIVQQTAHGLGPNQMVYYPVPVAVGGLILYGAYIVAAVFGSDSYSITAASAAGSTASAAGTVPSFTTTPGSSTVSVTLPGHGQNTGQKFWISLPVTVGGITLSGPCQVVGVSSSSVFAIQAPQAAISSATVFMNGGQAQAQTQAYGVDPIDYILYPLSRTDYASQPDKYIPYRPTTYWFDRLVTPTLTLWNVPDGNGPYVLNLWIMAQPNLAALPNGAPPDLPFRWYEAFASGLAAKLARKYPPPPSTGVTVADLRAEAQEALQAALGEDIERVPLFITPGLRSYYR